MKNQKRLIINKETSEKQKQTNNHTEKTIVQTLYDKKRNVVFDTKSVTVHSVDGALMNIDQDIGIGRLLFFYHIPALESVDEKNGKKQLMNRCTVEVRMDLRAMANIANCILEKISTPVEKIEKKQAQLTNFLKNQDEQIMFG